MKIHPTFNIQHRTPNTERLAGRPHSKLGVECSMFNVSPFINRRLSPVTRHPERGIALVITLILLSVTLVMALAFLAVSRRERNSVTTAADTTTARLATDTALAAAQAQIMANVLATNAAAYDYGLLVSTNYINPLGFDPNSGNPTNVNYDHLINNGGALTTPDERNQNIADLWLLPRAPVFINTNDGSPLDFRFFLDLNRNGEFDANNDATNYDSAGNPVLVNGNPLLTSQPGDPEWIGVLEHPDQPHGPDNPFVARYAFIAQPVGNALDLNYIHNQTLSASLANPFSAANDGYFRNEGVGSWELNLAAFLADLNTNQWNPPTIENPANNPYIYRQPSFANLGVAFADAQSLLAWRYANYYPSLAVAPQNVFDMANAGLVDGYTVGNPMTSTYLPTVLVPTVKNWAGSDNPNRFFSLPSDLFDSTKSSPAFVNRLNLADNGNGAANPTIYDRYTFYRMLDQIGTDSTADNNKLDLNYSNAVVNYDANGVVTSINIIPGAETNAVPWNPRDFFNAAADRMLRAYTTNWYAANPTNFLATYYGTIPNNYIAPNGYGLTNFPYSGMTNEVPAFGITNIPVYVNGQFVYTPAVNRLLQLAANIYDASTNQTAALGRDYPSVFKPFFNVIQNPNGTYNDVYIAGYTNISSVTGTNDPNFLQPTNASTVAAANLGFVSPLVNIYGVPWIIGAKKGFPAFNQLSMINSAQFTRRLEAVRQTVSGPVTTTNQMVTIGINNIMGASFWNSYSNDYVPNGNLYIYAYNNVQMVLTNSDGFYASVTFPTYYSFTTNRWSGTKWGPNDVSEPNPYSFISYGWTNNLVPDGLAYDFANHKFVSTNSLSAWDPNLSPLPQFGLTTTNQLQAYILDGNHVIDYVQLRGPIDTRNLTAALQDYDPNYPGPTPYYLWSTNLEKGGLSWGIQNQLTISSQPVGANLPASAIWTATPIAGIPNTTTAQQDFFAAAFTPAPHSFNYNGKTYYNNQLVSQAPYTATRTIFGTYLYQVNDPLVHYLASDLDAGTGAVWQNSGAIPNGVWHQNNGTPAYAFPAPPANNILAGQSRFQPWGQTVPTAFQATGYNFTSYNRNYKDSLVWDSDYWDFPTGKYPTVGWLGRVHRGTPWQTVYLKAKDEVRDFMNGNNNIGLNTWKAWTGDNELTYGQIYDASNSAPVQDRLLFDLFNTGLNDNATRGTLSVNVGADQPGPTAGLAAWSALFSGMVVLSNSAPSVSTGSPLTYTNLIINPAGAGGAYSSLGGIVTNINYTRSLFSPGAFTHVGDILSVPALTEQSPFLNWNDTDQEHYGISDELYEWLPQQAMGLLRVGGSPRYVVYCYGQTLRPAQNGLVLSGNNFGLCTNYQITAESAARAIIRVDAHPALTGTNYTTTVESYNVLPPN
jgi:hypothetical protein